MRENLFRHLEVTNKMDNSQHGSRKGRSTLSQLLEHHHEIVKILESGENADVVYLDFAKAFDKCDINILLHKAKKLGIKGNLLRWIANFLKERKPVSYTHLPLPTKRIV